MNPVTNYVRYRDIPRDERKRLAAEACRRVPGLRRWPAFAVFMSVVFSSLVSGSLVPRGSSFLLRLGCNILFVLVLLALSWGLFGQPKLKAEVERLKNT